MYWQIIQKQDTIRLWKNEMQEIFENFIRLFSPPAQGIKPTEKTIKKYKGKLPDGLFVLWKEYGFGNYGDGLVKIINPSDYEEVQGINKTVDISFLVTAFGDIFIYRFIPDKKLKAVGILNMHFRSREFFIVGEDCIEQFFDGIDISLPILRTGLYREAVEKHNGIPAHDEIFFFTPALGMGGDENIKFVDKGKALVHYEILSQMLGSDFNANY